MFGLSLTSAGRKLVTAGLCLATLAFVGLAGCDGQNSGGGTGGGTSQNGTATYEIAVIPKGTAHPYWKAVHGGAAKAGKELGAEIIWNGPPSERARSQQIEIMRNFTSRQVDAIVLAPLDREALVRPVTTAVNRGIPVVIIDSGLETDVYSSFVATDNRKGGSMGGEKLGELMGGEGRAIMMRYNPGSASTANREEGFLEAIREKYPDIEMVSTDQFAGVTRETALKTGQNLLTKFPDIEGIFCPNESSTFGMMRALKKAGMPKEEIKFVGFDATSDLVDGLKDGWVDALVAQDPFNMGYTGVSTAIKAIKGEKVEKSIPTRSVMVTRDNLDDEDIQKIIDPPIQKWLD